ncbi:bifunctional folylpolyglutamate synthase/dihydrofolate synthase [Pinibacter soli]|nr:folylpolyglutamate synthase/dihydrofolate synthase family protein [Pinibacter soli]
MNYLYITMDYQQTIDYLFHRLPIFSRIGAAAYKKDLDNTLRLCEILDNPHKKFKTVHIAGTNGKGSTSHMLAAIFQTAGYKTGLYTSPHLKDFRERIKINGNMISEQFVVDFTKKIQPHIDEIEPSFFEITVAMAFDYFATEQVDIAIVEVGLGGRLDSTNVITPEVSVITNIGMDHMNILGDSLEKIAFEKAGIMKPHIPVVVGEILPETKPVFEEVSAAQKTPMIIAPDKRRSIDWKYNHHLLTVEVSTLHTDEMNFYELDLPGIYQTKNLVTVLEAVHQLQQKGWKISHENILHALKNIKKLTGLFGRWQIIHQNPSVILDVGHNEDGIKAIVSQLEVTTYHRLHIVFGMVKDKDITTVLKLLPKHATYYFTQAQIPRALDAESLKEESAKFDLYGKSFPTVNEAAKDAISDAEKDDLILICGSVFIVGEVQLG